MSYSVFGNSVTSLSMRLKVLLSTLLFNGKLRILPAILACALHVPNDRSVEIQVLNLFMHSCLEQDSVFPSLQVFLWLSRRHVQY